LTTCNFAAPDDFKTTSNSVCSLPASAPPPPAEGPATATAAAAGSIPYSSLSIVANSLTSFTDKLTNYFKCWKHFFLILFF
jgi:hypothetical protein